MLEDFYLPMRLAVWNRARSVWETGQMQFLCEHSVPFLATWPTSGMTRNGVAFELPTPELHTGDSGSSLLPTPDVPNGGRAIPEDAVWSGKAAYKPNGKKMQVGIGQIQKLLKTPTSLMPTPRTSDTNGAGAHGTGGPDLRTVVSLLPSPAANDSGNTPENHLRKKPGRQVVTSLMVLVDGGLIATGGKLLPTPVASEGTKATTLQGSAEKGLTGQLWLTNIAHDLAVLNGEFIAPRKTKGQ